MLGRLLGILLGLVGLAALVVVGGYFALRRADIPYETLAAKYESAASRYVDLPDGVHMHYRDEGAQGGPVVLLIHGFSASLHTWEPWVQRLGENYRVITLDLPGHGLTRAPAGYQGSINGFRDEVAAFVQTQGLTEFAIGGNSMGGHVALEYALAYPDQLNALLLVDSAGWPKTARAGEDEGQGPIIFKLLANPITAAIVRDLDNSRLIRQGLLSAFPAHPDLVDDVMVARYSELSRAPGHRDIILGLMRETPPFATPERLAALHMPVLIMHGTDDRLIPFAHAQRFHDSIVGSQLASLEGIGHAPQEEVPDQSATIASEFLYGVVEGSALAAE